VRALAGTKRAAALVGLERARWFLPKLAADGPVAQCVAERAAEIDEIVNQGRIQAGQAGPFKPRALQMCAGGGPAGAPCIRSGAALRAEPCLK
jgi:hypothetical protein